MKRKYKLDCKYFNNIDTHDKAYILGLLAADGYNNHKDGEIVIGQAGFDNIEILEKIKKCIKSNQPLGCIKRSEQNDNWQDFYTLSIYSREISDNLLSLGVIQNKSNFLNYPVIPKEFDSSFILGYFDGDGSISIDEKRYNRGSITFTGNNLLIEIIQKKICDITGYKGYIYTRNENSPNIITLSYSGSKSTTTILYWLYSNSNIYLKRKKEKFDFLVDIHKERMKKRDEKNNIKKEKEVNTKTQKDIQHSLIISLLDKGYSIRQISLQFNIDKRKTRKIINEIGYEYPERKRMFAKDPKSCNNI